MAGIVGKGTAVHALTFSGITVCGAESRRNALGSRTSSDIRETNDEITCKHCLKHTPEAPATVTPEPVNYGPNAKENFTAMFQAATSHAAKMFWSRKLAELPV